MRPTGHTGRRGKPTRANPPGLGKKVEHKLNEGRLYTTWCEEYGPDGEIVKATEWRPVPWQTFAFYIVTGTGYAEPKTDWRERGVIPPRGVHPWKDEAEAASARDADAPTPSPPSTERRE
jgi:hypothetical protein